MFILQKSLKSYFKEISRNNKVVFCSNCLDAILFKNMEDAKKFKVVLEDYNCKVKIIEI